MKKITYSSIFLLLVLSGGVEARKYEFDARYIAGGYSDIFNKNMMDNGNYDVDVFVNDKYIGVEELYLKDIDGQLTPCITKAQLLIYQIIKSEADKFKYDKELCLIFDKRISFTYNAYSHRLNLSINNTLLKNNNDGIEDPSLWNNGINAFLLNYRANYMNSNVPRGESFSGTFEPGVNFGAWRLRNLTTWVKDNNKNIFKPVYSYLERALPSLKSKLTIGDRYTDNILFDSIPFRGISIKSDDSMIPFAMRSYVPTISGIARTHARVEVSKNGYLLYSTTVPQGEFKIKDASLFNLGSGELNVKVIEDNGDVQIYSIPYSTPVFSISENSFRFEIASGQYRSYDSQVVKKTFLEGSGIYGLPFGMSVFSGSQLSNVYQSFSLGISKDLGNIGAAALNVTQSKSRPKDIDGTLSGTAIGIKYNKFIGKSDTNISIDANNYFSSKFRTLPEIFDSYSEQSFYNPFPKKKNFSFNINQRMDKYGSLLIGFKRDQYWNNKHVDNINVGYNKSIGSSQLSFAYAKNKVKGNNSFKTQDVINLWVSMPFGMVSNNPVYANYQLTSSNKRANHEIGLSGTGFDRQLSWQVREQIKENSNERSNSYLQSSWRGTYGQIGFDFNQSQQKKSFSTNVSGGMVVHDQGITLGQRLSSTNALVEAKDISGAQVLGLPGIYTDFRGYASAGGLTPYQKTLYLSIQPPYRKMVTLSKQI